MLNAFNYPHDTIVRERWFFFMIVTKRNPTFTLIMECNMPGIQEYPIIARQ